MSNFHPSGRIPQLEANRKSRILKKDAELLKSGEAYGDWPTGILRPATEDTVLHPHLDGMANETMIDELQKLAEPQWRGQLQNKFLRDKVMEMGFDPDKIVNMGVGRRFKVAKKLLRIIHDLEHTMREKGLAEFSKAQNLTAQVVAALAQRDKPDSSVATAMARIQHNLSKSKVEFTDTDHLNIRDLTDRLSIGGVVFEKPQGTSLHHFIDWLEKGRYDVGHQSVMGMLKNNFQSFVVEHDWAKAFEGTEGFSDDGDIRLPFDFTCFEFKITGLRVLVFIAMGEGGKQMGFIANGINRQWYVTGTMFRFINGRLIDDSTDSDLIQGFLAALSNQIRAVCIMLDAKVAYGDRQSAGEGLNRKRAREGRTAIKPYHVVKLNRKRWRSNRQDSEPTGARRACHWRRAHWRHFNSPGGQVKYHDENGILVSKTRIEWMLVGDPDLGFVDKHYSL